MARQRVRALRHMEQAPTTDRALSLDEAVSIAIQLQKNEQWVAATDIYRRVLEVAPDYPDAVHYSECWRIKWGGMSRPSS